jgi:lysine biosynthesis protein LysW
MGVAMGVSLCPKCNASIALDEEDFDDIEPLKAFRLDCPECGTDLEVVCVDPFELDVAPQEEK